MCLCGSPLALTACLVWPVVPQVGAHRVGRSGRVRCHRDHLCFKPLGPRSESPSSNSCHVRSRQLPVRRLGADACARLRHGLGGLHGSASAARRLAHPCRRRTSLSRGTSTTTRCSTFRQPHRRRTAESTVSAAPLHVRCILGSLGSILFCVSGRHAHNPLVAGLLHCSQPRHGALQVPKHRVGLRQHAEREHVLADSDGHWQLLLLLPSVPVSLTFVDGPSNAASACSSLQGHGVSPEFLLVRLLEALWPLVRAGHREPAALPPNHTRPSLPTPCQDELQRAQHE
jgi:hypothetical protein